MPDPTDDAGRKELLKSAYRKIEELRARLAAVEGRGAEPVAIVGMGCRFPGGVTDADSYWRLLSRGMDGIVEIPPDRWDVDAFYDPDPDAPGKMYVRRGGFIDKVREFDPLFFHVSPQEATSMDPQQRMLLEVAWEALEDAGIAADRLDGTPTGVFVGLASGDFPMLALLSDKQPTDGTHTATGSSPAIAAGRISYFFGLRGPCMAVDTACASGFTAVHLAVQSLRKGESRMAIAASVNLILSPASNMIICKARMLSPDGKCKTFDASADGYVRGEGSAALVLKLLSQAEADGDRILAVIRGTACNQDGRTNGITAPNGNAQREVIKEALASAGLSPREIDYVETHGTGTSLGDPIELRALSEVFSQDRPEDRKLILGAVKTNIGHLEPVAGMAAIIKVILSLQKGQIPPNLHFNNPNPLIDWQALPFSVPVQLTDWPNGRGPRKAGASAFGFSGTNVHVVVEEAPRRTVPAIEQDRPCHLLTLSGQAPKALSDLAQRYAQWLAINPGANLADVCFTANTGRSTFAYRLALVASTVEEARAQLERFTADPSAAGSVHTGRAPGQAPQLGWFISAQSLGDLHRQLYRQFPVFRSAFDECNSAALDLCGVALPADLWTQSGTEALSPLPNAILEFALGHAMAAQWHDWGIHPAALSGCGIGCSVAAVFAGALSLRDGLSLALDPHSGASLAWSAPRFPLLSPLTGKLLTAESLKNAAEWSASSNHASELAGRVAGFQREGIQILLGIGADLSRSFPADSPLPCIAPPDTGWIGLLHAMAALFVAGIPADWKHLDRPWPRQRLALPTYPFQRQECWPKFGGPRTQTGSSSRPDAHLLLGRRIYSSQERDEIVFESEFSTERLPMLKDHQFFSTVVVPAAAMLEMGAAAGKIALGSAVAITDFVIEQPLILPEKKNALVQTVLTPAGANAFDFVILSADIEELDQSPVWKRHGSGKVKTEDYPAPAADPGLLDRLKARFNHPVDPDWIYATAANVGAQYGPMFQAMQTIFEGENGSLVLLKLSPECARQVAEFGVHPILLDAALQSTGISQMVEKPDSKNIYMPIMIDSYRMAASGFTEIWCQGTIRAVEDEDQETRLGEVQFYSAAGQAIGELRGIHFKRNAKKDFAQEMVEQKLASWLYDTSWETLPLLPPAANATGTWLIVSQGDPAATELATAIRRRRGHPVVAHIGAEWSRQSDNAFTIRPGSASDCDDLLKAVNQSEPLRGMIYMVSSAPDEAGRSVPGLAFSITEQLLHLTQALARHVPGDLSALAIVTRGFEAPALGARSGIAVAAAWGLGRVISSELPGLHCKLIDLDPALSDEDAAGLLADELCSDSDENQLALGQGKRLALRLGNAGSSIFAGRRSSPASSGASALKIGARGDFRQLRFVDQQLEPPGPHQVQVRVFATGVNFRDVLNVLGLYPGDPGEPGVECVGEIVAIGPNVTGWKIGDQVLASTLGGFATYTNTFAHLVFPRPANLPLADAATILVAYMTAAWSLCHLGRMKAGDRVLIHAATGGVGLAAVQLALKAGAEVFATAGNPAKREYLRQMGVRHVMDSRSLGFAETIREVTGGEGLDLVLDSLTGDAVTEGLRLLKPGGSFLEIGKNGILPLEEVAAVNPGIHYHTVDLPMLMIEHREEMEGLYRYVTDGLADGSLRPLPHRVYSKAETPQALRYMSTARHIGKIVVIDPAAAPATRFEPSGSYLITGGLGGLGLLVAKWMVSEGARHLLLAGRSAPNPAAENAIAELESLGAKITVASVDISDRQQVAGLLAKVPVSSPLRGIIHAAGVLDDGVLLSQDWSRFNRVLKPKIDGAWNLHELTLGMPLDFFVLFSSSAGILGSAGQSNYAAGNVFMDALAQARQAAGLPAISIDWGAWGEVGMAASLDDRHAKGWDAQGISVIEPSEGLAILQALIAKNDVPQIAVVPVQQSALRPPAGQPIPPIFRKLAAAAGVKTAAAAPVNHREAAERLRQAAPAHRREILIELVGEMVLEVFGLDGSRSIPPDQNLTMLGMDSLLAIQLSNRLKSSFGSAVPSTLTFQYPTMEAIADYLLEALATAAGESERHANGKTHAPASAIVEIGAELDAGKAEALLANLDQLSDHEVEALLGAMESKPASQ